MRAFTVAVVVMCVAVGDASALVIHPTRTDDPSSGGNLCTPTPTDCSLRNAIITGDTVSLAPPAPAGPYILSRGEIQLGNGGTVVGVSARSSIIDQTAAQSVFEVDGGTLSLTGVTVEGGQVHDGGAGIYNEGTVILNGVTVTNNQVTALPSGTSPVYGAGIYNLGRLVVTNSTITGNTVTSSINGQQGVLAYGGGIANGPGFGSGASASISNSTITGNSARMTQELTGGAGGGGIYDRAGLIQLANDTVAANNGDVGGGNIFLDTGATAEITDTIVAGGTSTFNKAEDNCLFQGGGAILQESYNLENQHQCGFTGTGDLVDVDPLLGSLANNGGGTDTLAILFSSPALDHGNPSGCTDTLGAALTTDQRGIARPQGPRCDIGAFELAYHTLTVSHSGSAGAVRSTDATIECGAICSHAYPAGRTVTLDARPASGSQFAGWSGACRGTGACKVTINADKRVTATFSKSAPPPNTAITGVHISSAKRDATFDFTGSGGVGALRFQCKLDARDWTSCTSPKTYAGLSRGSHRFQVRAIDSRGQVDPTPASHSFTI